MAHLTHCPLCGIVLTNIPYFAIGDCYHLLGNRFAGVPIYVTGNPQTVREDSGNPIDNSVARKLYSEYGSVYTDGDDANGHNTLFRFDTDSTGGDSGSPVYTITKNTLDSNVTYTYTALTTCHGLGGANCNAGPRFTKYHQQFYLGNQNAAY